MDLVVDPAPDGVKLPGTGYTSGGLQDNVTISNDKGLIGGHLKYTTGMVTMYPDDRLKQEGNFIALWLHEIGDPYVNYDKIEAKVVNSEDEKELEVSDEGYICFRVDDRATTKLVVTVTIGEQTYEKEFKLTALTVDEYGWNILKYTNMDGSGDFNFLDTRANVLTNLWWKDTPEDVWTMYGGGSNAMLTYGGSVHTATLDDDLPNEWIKSRIEMVADGVTFNSNHTYIGVAQQGFPFKKGTDYTFSCYCKQSGVSQFSVAGTVYHLNDKGTAIDTQLGQGGTYSKSFEVGEDWTYIEYTFRIDDEILDESNSVVLLRFGPSNISQMPSTFTASYAGMKLEEGDNATGWDDYYSGDNLLLDSDQPSFEKVNPNVANNLYRDSGGGSTTKPAKISFMTDDELPYENALINCKYSLSNSKIYAALIFRMYTIPSFYSSFKIGEPFTFSFYAKSNEPNYSALVSSYRTETKILLKFNTTNQWKRYYCTFINDFDGEEYQNLNERFISITFDNIEESFASDICGIKLERGCHPTDYRPAPSDFNINYLLNSEAEYTHSVKPDDGTVAPDINTYKVISSFSDISLNTPLIISAGKVSCTGTGTGAKIYNSTVDPVFLHWQDLGIIKSGENNWLKSSMADISTVPNYQPGSSKISGFVASAEPVNSQADDGTVTISKLKIEVGRYPTKWVEGSGEPVAASDEEDDLEVT